MKSKVTTKRDNLERALQTLEQAIKDDDGGDYLRDAIIQRFEYTLKLAWKYLQAELNSQWVETFGPKDILRKAG